MDVNVEIGELSVMRWHVRPTVVIIQQAHEATHICLIQA